MANRFRVRTEKGSEYIVDLDRRALSKNRQKIPLNDGAVNILSLEQRAQINIQGSYDHIFEHGKFPPSTKYEDGQDRLIRLLL